VLPPALSGIPGYVTPSIARVAGEDHLVMITGAVGRGRSARDGSVNGYGAGTAMINVEKKPRCPAARRRRCRDQSVPAQRGHRAHP
jgi:hypothetical protein